MASVFLFKTAFLVKMSKEVLSTPVSFLFIARWVWLPKHKQRSPTFQCYPVLSFSVNSPRVPYLCAFWWCPFSSLHLSESIGTTPNPSQSTSASCSVLARWVFSWALALKRKKRMRLWETEKWYLTDCRLREKNVVGCNPVLSGALFGVPGQRPDSVSQPRRAWGPRSTSLATVGVTHVAYWLNSSHTCYCRFIFILSNSLTFHNTIATKWKSCEFLGSLCIVQLNLVKCPFLISSFWILRINQMKVNFCVATCTLLERSDSVLLFPVKSIQHFAFSILCLSPFSPANNVFNTNYIVF